MEDVDGLPLTPTRAAETGKGSNTDIIDLVATEVEQ